MTTNRETVLQLLPAFTLGALEADEMLTVESYIEEQQLFLAHVAQTEDALALMAFTAPMATPPDGVKQRLMARLARDPLAIKGTATRNQSPVHRPRREWHYGWLQTMGTAVATAAIVATVGLSFYTSFLQDRVAAMASQGQAAVVNAQALFSENDTLAAENASLARQLAALAANNQALVTQNQQLAQQQQQITQNLDLVASRLNLVGSANEAVILNSSPEAPNSRGAFYVSGPQAAVVVHGLQPLPPDRIYQFWWVTPDGDQFPVAPVTVRVGVEPTWALFRVPADLPPFTVVGISVEPAAGSPVPTGPMIVEGRQG